MPKRGIRIPVRDAAVFSAGTTVRIVKTTEEEIKMKKLFNMSVGLLLMAPGLTQAQVTQEDFLVKATQNLINLCTASSEQPMYQEAIHFCHGYLVGAWHFHRAEAADHPDKLLVCFSEPYPSRNEVIEMFIAWAQNHPEFMNEQPVETEFRFLSEKWPCKK